MTDTLTEKRKTAQNYRSEILEARVIANYGDPGLDEDYHFDILSRYVIVMIESWQRVLTADKYTHMLAVVKRPEPLWIEASSLPDENPVNQKRMDAQGNVSVGAAGSFSSNSISRIYPAYTFGETIRIRKLSQPLPTTDSFFYSKFRTWDDSTRNYGSWHSEGSSLPYFSTDAMRASLKTKTISPVATNSYYYSALLHKLHYEAMILNLAQSSSSLTAGLTAIFNGSWGGNAAVYTANGGYLFANNNYVLLSAVSFEDMNIDNKARVATNDCVPLVVTTPNSFPIPSVRSVGTIIYNPTYSPLVR